MKLRKIIAMAVSVMAIGSVLAGCGEVQEKADETKPVILAVSFGTSYNDNREKTIGAVEKAIADANPDYEVRRAFTSQIVIDVIKERNGEEIDNVEQALEKLVNDGVKEVVIQPTHIMNGFEYDGLAAVVEEYKDKFESVSIGTPLLTSDRDYTKLAEAITAATTEYNTEGTAVVFMGHGTEHEANSAYTKLQDTLAEQGAENYFIGTVEAAPALEDVMAMVKAGGFEKVVLHPLMLVAGDHANNDMAGDGEDSWKSAFTAEGFEVECVLKGLGEISAVQKIYTEHVIEAIQLK